MLKVCVGHGVRAYALGISLLFAVSAFVPSAALGDGVAYHFTNLFSGTAPASLNQPWIDAAFHDFSPGVVRLTVSNLNLIRRESLGELYLNLNTNLSPSHLRFSLAGGSGGFDRPKISTGLNKFKADGDGKYDIRFSFNQGGGQDHRFTAGEYLVCDISGIAALTASDFAFLSAPAGGAGPFYAAAHIQRIANSTLSGWIAPGGVSVAPEPSVASLATLGFGIFVHLKRRRKKSQ